MDNACTTALKNKVNGIKKTVIDKTSDVLSAPARIYYGAKERQGNRDADTLKNAREMKNVPDFDKKGAPTEALKVRTAADVIRDRINKKSN